MKNGMPGLSVMKYSLFPGMVCLLWLQTPEVHADAGGLVPFTCTATTVANLRSTRTASAQVNNAAVSIDYWWGQDLYTSTISHNTSATPSDLESVKTRILAQLQQNSVIRFASFTFNRTLIFSGRGNFSEATISDLNGGATITPGSWSNNAILAFPGYSAGISTDNAFELNKTTDWYFFNPGGSNGLLSTTINLPDVGNEYVSRNFTISIQPTSGHSGISGAINLDYASGDVYTPGFQIRNGVYSCTREATPLTLTLHQPTLDFNSIQTGATTPVTRELNWSASGTGQASIWTLTFDTDADKKDGDYILLGNAKVRILDAGSAQVPLATPVNISGVTGSYTFELDPTGATPSTPETSVNVTLTAN